LETLTLSKPLVGYLNKEMPRKGAAQPVCQHERRRGRYDNGY
jgi:hypothetical protein